MEETRTTLAIVEAPEGMVLLLAIHISEQGQGVAALEFDPVLAGNLDALLASRA